jgi:hypothetical protein
MPFEQGTVTTPPARLAGLLPSDGWTSMDRTINPRRRVVDARSPRDEELIVDGRCAISPAQMVEDKLARLLKDSSLPVSHLQMRSLLRSR